MDIILIPGMWLDASSWERVLPALEVAGHRLHPLTLPGMESRDTDRTDASLADLVAAVGSVIDQCPDRVLLVAHSAGGGVAHAAVDAHPERVARVIYIGGFPAPDGAPVVDGFQVDKGGIPLPEWDEFEEGDLRDLDEGELDEFRRRAIPAPACLTTDAQHLSDERRYEVPVTVICNEFSAGILQSWIEQGMTPVTELARMHHMEFVDLPTGHWPQFTRPDDLGRLIADRAYEPHIDEHGRVHPPGEGDEALIALGFLDYQRSTLEWKTRGLETDGLNATTAVSALSLGGLLKHMAWVEQYWFSYWLHDRAPTAPWDTVDWSAEPDWEFTSARDDSPEELLEMWRTAVARSRALTAAAIDEGGFDHPAAKHNQDGTTVGLRWIVLHMIEEYARHNGHADLLRESIDGEIGE